MRRVACSPDDAHLAGSLLLPALLQQPDQGFHFMHHLLAFAPLREVRAGVWAVDSVFPS